MVNGGEAVTLQFQRSPFRPQTKTLYVPWNQIVSLSTIKMTLHEEMDSYKETTVDTTGEWALSWVILVSIRVFRLDAIVKKYAIMKLICVCAGLYEQNVYNVTPCVDHKESPQIISTWLPEKIGGMPGKSVIFAETQVKTHTIFKLLIYELYLKNRSTNSCTYMSSVPNI